MKKGICVAGNLILDKIYPIEVYPEKHALTTILGEAEYAAGGALCNVAIDFAKLDPNVEIKTVGIVGEDDDGTYILDALRRFPNIDISGIGRQGVTSVTLVMTEAATKHRTFFQYRGANALLDETCFNWDCLDVELLHIGYILLLDALDREDDEYGTAMARLLANAKKKGIKTSVDVVSEAGHRFRKLVPPALKYTDYCIINEIEAQEATGICLRDEAGNLLDENMREALSSLFGMGVTEWAVIHAPECVYGMDNKANYMAQKSLELPQGYIKGTVGAGDAFCAGVLYSAYRQWDLKEALRIGVATAAASLSAAGATDGVGGLEQVKEIYETYRGSV